MLDRLPAFVRAWFIGDLLVASLYALNISVLAWLFRPLAIIDMDREGNLPAWFATLQLGVVGLLLACFAWLMIRRHGGRGWALVIPAALAMFLSVDEFAQLHERLRPLTATDLLPVSGGWLLLAVPAFLALVVVVALLTAPFWQPRAVRIRLLMGIGLYALAVGGIEAAHNFVPQGSAAHLLLVLVEETGELLAVTVVLWAVYDLLAWHGVRVRIDG